MQYAKNKVFLHPGDFHFGQADTHVHTLLGSCVAITLWHPQRRIGGMCHFVLPKRSTYARDLVPDGQYADEAVELFRSAVATWGSRLTDYQGKIFGGANMFGAMGDSTQDRIGTRNAETAFELLMAHQVPVLVAHVGETGVRRIVFDIASGDVWVRHQLADGSALKSISGPV